MSNPPTTTSVPLSISLEDANRDVWDVLVLGAGPAGAMAALLTARRGARVLLVDRARFPRWKVCGCCLNRAAATVLAEAGLNGLLDRLGARPLHLLHLHARGRRAAIPLPGGAAVSRQALDAALVNQAVAAGAAFLPETTAAIRRDSIANGSVELLLKAKHRQVVVRGRMVLAATGLGARLFAERDRGDEVITPASRIGVAAVLPAVGSSPPEGVVTMACGRGGYVGQVRLEDGRLELAAALDAGLLRRRGNPAAAIADILEQAGLSPPAHLATAHLRGTPALTRRRRRRSWPRVLVLGDAAGYVEPFTGEGIAWALQSARMAAPLAIEGAERWSPHIQQQWERAWRGGLAPRHRACRRLSLLLRRPRLTAAVTGLLSYAPALAQRYVHNVYQPWASSAQS